MNMNKSSRKTIALVHGEFVDGSGEVAEFTEKAAASSH
jgi:hypothetical protein